MDESRFDALARSWGTTRSRRAAARALAGGALAALLGRAEGVAAARCRADRDCRGAFQKCCNRRCVDTSADPQNCGRCNHTCDEDEVCRNGACQSTCPTGQVRCGRRRECTNLATDPQNCGRCGKECLPNETCGRGECKCSGARCAEGPIGPQCCTDGASCCPGRPTGCCPREGVCTNRGQACCPRAQPKFCPAGTRGEGGCCAANDDCCAGLCCPPTATCWPDGTCCPDGTHSCGDGTCCPDGRRCTRLGCVRGGAAGAATEPRVAAAPRGAADL
jgi:hypothetical protein